MTDTNTEPTELTTDQQILENIGEGTPGEQATDGDKASTTEATTDASTTSDKEASRQSGDQSTGTKQGTQQTPGPKDLIDRQGNIIAKGGPERRHYETAQRLKQENTTLTNRVTQLEGESKAIAGAGNLGTQFNLTPDELTTGAQIMAAFKENPADTVKYLLTQTQAAGHNIDGIGGTTDSAAIKQMLETALAPFVQERQDRLDTQNREQEALYTYNAFSAKYPDAAIHENSLARLIETDNSLTPDTAYFKLKAFYAEKGLDWNVPLETYARAAQAQKNKRADETSDATQLPSGGTDDANVTNTPIVADPSESYDNIIRESMKEAGVT
jgi:hypothetical protein|tara:strand:- start:1649 stop:2632 length:984 start_codon:yes stop_codon:yes gene_type:complete